MATELFKALRIEWKKLVAETVFADDSISVTLANELLNLVAQLPQEGSSVSVRVLPNWQTAGPTWAIPASTTICNIFFALLEKRLATQGIGAELVSLNGVSMSNICISDKLRHFINASSVSTLWPFMQVQALFLLELFSAANLGTTQSLATSSVNIRTQLLRTRQDFLTSCGSSSSVAVSFYFVKRTQHSLCYSWVFPYRYHWGWKVSKDLCMGS